MRGALVAGAMLMVLVGVATGLAGPVSAQDSCYYDFEEERVRCDPPNESGGSEDEDEPWWARPSVEVGLGVFGLTASAVGGGWAVLRRRRQRDTLREMLDEVETVYADHKTQPDEGLPELAELRTTVRDHHAGGKLTDSQFLELDKRIGERVARLRLLKVDRDLPELPSALETELEHVIEDGTVSPNDVAHIRERTVALEVSDEAASTLVALLEAWAEDDRAARSDAS